MRRSNGMVAVSFLFALLYLSLNKICPLLKIYFFFCSFVFVHFMIVVGYFRDGNNPISMYEYVRRCAECKE